MYHLLRVLGFVAVAVGLAGCPGGGGEVKTPTDVSLTNICPRQDAKGGSPTVNIAIDCPTTTTPAPVVVPPVVSR